MLHMKLSKWTSRAGMSAFLMFSLSSGRFMLSWRLKRVEIVLKKNYRMQQTLRLYRQRTFRNWCMLTISFTFCFFLQHLPNVGNPDWFSKTISISCFAILRMYKFFSERLLIELAKTGPIEHDRSYSQLLHSPDPRPCTYDQP